ncbi:MAG: hypothetical protein FRX48_04579 [Lasallia pustulata]|uniref:Terpene synthase n=1 Tax=Lasallia pustulata TaxID=136370 RepID=A0A5M8PQQ6_9LECA|nr:MAG: hypothetical protein FRX48_04579 [Lasallia pustulata]
MGSLQMISRQQLLHSLRGQSLVIPDLRTLFDHWPQGVNPEVERLREDVESRLEMLFPGSERLRKMKAADFGLLSASWWPYADYEALRISTYLNLWLFAWDDETDSPEYSEEVANVEKGALFRTETIQYLRQCLAEDVDSLTFETASNIITNFKPVGEAVSRSCTPAQRESFLNELVYFVRMTKVEQRFQCSKEFPTVEEYLDCRLGTSAVGPCLAMTEYCYDMEIPPPIMHESDMRTLWDATNRVISICNDMLSLNKELAQKQVDTLIPLLYIRHGSLPAAFDNAVETVKCSIQAVDSSSQKLLARYSQDPVVYDKLQKFICGCKYACTANVNWSLSTARYGLEPQDMRAGIKLTL